MNKRIKKKRAKLTVQEPLTSKREQKILAKSKVLESLRTPEKWEGRLQNEGQYYQAIKKYKDYINKGLIRESSILDKYESAENFVSTLSEGEIKSLLKEGDTKNELIMEHRAAREQARWDQYKNINF